MWLRLKQWYSLDIYEQEEDRRIARILLGIIFVYGFLSLWLALMGLIWGDRNLIFSLVIGCCIQIIPLFFLLRGNLSASSFITVGLYIVFITIFATLGLGIRDYVIMAYPMVIVFAGLAEKQRGLVVSTLLTSMAFAWLTLGEKYGWFLTHPIFTPTWFDLIITILMIVFVALEVNLMVTNLKDRLVQLRHELVERKQIEVALKESELRYRALAEASHDMIFVIGQDDCIAYVNSYAAQQLGAQPEELMGQLRSHWFEKFDSDKMREGLEFVFETGQPSYAETDVVFPNGATYLSTWLFPLNDQDGRVDSVLGVSRDISAQKKLQDSLKEANLLLNSLVEERTAELRDSRDQLRTLSQQVIFAQEEERLRLSRDLHDDAGQVLIGLRLNLELIYNDLPVNSKKLRERMVNTLALVDQTVNRIRTLSHNLRPPVLDILGVNMGIKELCGEFSGQTRILVEYVGVELKDLQDDISISLYRFVQEALTNVVKHARAHKVKVILEYKNKMIQLSVEDDGQGISASAEGSGLGMVGIKERFNNLGGWLEISSGVTGGTLIKVFLPWKSKVI